MERCRSPRTVKIAMSALATAALLSTSFGCFRLLEGGFFAAQAAAPISQEQEIAIGDAATQQVLSQNPLYTDPQVNAYVNAIGRQMAQQTGRTELPWRFLILDSEQQNAFALPGGNVFVTTGILRSMDNAAQLAGVLGHEAGHVAARHGIAQIKRAMLARGILVTALGDSPAASQIAGQIAAELVLRGYGREAELEADTLGATYASKADYDPNQLAAFLAGLGKAGVSPSWISPLESHPPIQERVERLEGFIQRKHLAGNHLDAIPFKAAMAPLGKAP